MGVIAFSRPQDGMNYYKDVLDLMRVMQDIMKSPGSISTSINDLSKQLQAELALSEAKQAEAQNAQETIAQAKEAQDDLLAAKAEHAARVKMELGDLDKKYAAYQDSVKAMIDEKAATLKASEKAKSDGNAALAQAKLLSDAATARQTKAESIEKDTNAKLAAHQAALADFEKVKTQHAQDVAAADAAHEEKIQKLVQDTQIFELRKKKFEDALKA